ncbi:putative transducin beta-like protein 3 [Apostichopus japonicus]|uniref:Putative transducin beta-like protein 3 n=1 Tax=Stichopus japonicus TaxID=307972 RepID=A0A2G8JNP3_STIJA|nr:putative transducin beta-like protein 3 [Apostichopus japonicus]
MASLKTNFRVSSKIEAFYTGGKISVSKDGQYLFCPYGNNVNVLDTKTGRVIHTLKQEEGGEVTCLIISPDDEMLIVAYSNLLLKQWEWKQETCIRTWKAIHIAPVVSMAFDSTSTLLATGSSDSMIKVWDVIKQYCTHNLKGSQVVVNLLEFHPDPTKLLLFSASSDSVIRVWNLKTGKCEYQLTKHYSAVTSFSFNQDATLLFSTGRDSVVTIWDLNNFTARRTIPVFEPLEALLVLPNDKPFPELSIDTPGEYIVTCGGQGAVLQVFVDNLFEMDFHSARVDLKPLPGGFESLDVVSGRNIFTQPANLLEASKSNTYKEGETRVSQAIMCAALNTIVIATHDHNIVFFSIDNFKITKQMVGNNDEILDVKFLGADESHLAVASNSDQLRVFELSTLNCQILTGHTDIIVAIDVFKKGSMLVSSSKDNSVRLWQMNGEDNTLRCVAVGKGHTHSVLSVTASRLSRKFIVSGGEDMTFKVWRIPSELRKEAVSKDVTSLSVSFTEKAHDKSINSLAISPNDKLLATGSQDRSAKLWHLEQEKFLGSFRGHKRGIWCVQFSPTDQALATSSADGTIKIWSISDFTCVKTFEGHDASVLKVSFLSRGMQLLSSGSDGLLKLWTIKHNECIKTFDDHDDKVWAVTPNLEEDQVVTAGADSTIMVWQDMTLVEYEEKKEKEEEQVIREQQLSNLLHEKKFVKALGLAITLNQPFKVLTIVKTILDQPDGNEVLAKTVEKLSDDQTVLLLGFLQVWNTNAKHCHYAQLVLSIILKSCSSMDVMTSSNAKEVIEGLIPYTERHVQRMDRLMQQAMFIEYTWQTMRRATSGPSTSGSEKPNSSLLVEDLPEMSGIQEDASRGDQDERQVEQISDGREETSNEADMDEAPSDGESGLESETEETRDGRKGRKDEKRSNIAPEIRASSKDDGDEDVEEEEMDVMDKGTKDGEEHVGLNGDVGDERVSRTPGRKVRGTPREEWEA